MSYDKRQEDLDTIKVLPIGVRYYFNMFQGGGCCVERISEDKWELSEIPLYGGRAMCYDIYSEKDLMLLVDMGYSWV